MREDVGASVDGGFTIHPFHHDDDTHVALIRERGLKSQESRGWTSEAEA